MAVEEIAISAHLLGESHTDVLEFVSSKLSGSLHSVRIVSILALNLWSLSYLI